MAAGIALASTSEVNIDDYAHAAINNNKNLQQISNEISNEDGNQ